VREALKRDQLRSVELAPDLKGRTRDDERPVHVVTVGSIYVVEKGSVFVLVAVNGQGDLTALQESADLLEIENVGEGLQLLTQTQRAQMVVHHGDAQLSPCYALPLGSRSHPWARSKACWAAPPSDQS